MDKFLSFQLIFAPLMDAGVHKQRDEKLRKSRDQVADRSIRRGFSRVQRFMAKKLFSIYLCKP